MALRGMGNAVESPFHHCMQAKGEEITSFSCTGESIYHRASALPLCSSEWHRIEATHCREACAEAFGCLDEDAEGEGCERAVQQLPVLERHVDQDELDSVQRCAFELHAHLVTARTFTAPATKTASLDPGVLETVASGYFSGSPPRFVATSIESNTKSQFNTKLLPLCNTSLAEVLRTTLPAKLILSALGLRALSSCRPAAVFFKEGVSPLLRSFFPTVLGTSDRGRDLKRSSSRLRSNSGSSTLSDKQLHNARQGVRPVEGETLEVQIGTPDSRT